ncbi:MAG: phospho-N-acetylmuramoyl-pentapeptide-transferase [Planctomycetes bacterium]|nr:phospho-N-acetylmuramoyl-pentapeptide-transferase [Planctomycetota bacterium]
MPSDLARLDWRLCVLLLGLCALAALGSVLAGRLVIPVLVRRKLNDGEPRKASEYLNLLNSGKKHTPTMGGVFLVPVLLAASAPGGVLLVWLGADALKVWGALAIAAFVLVSHAALGMVDDWAKLNRRKGDGISGRAKLAVQTATALVACGAAVMLMGPENAVLHLFGWQWNLGWLLVPFGVFVMVGAGNAYNLTDGLDGLAGGTGAVAFHALAVAAALTALSGAGDADLGWTTAMLALTASGALVGFLFWNRHPARVFMGDTGSLSFGALLGLVAVLGRVEPVLAVAGGVFVAEALSVMLQVGWFKATGGRRILRCAPLHHHFQFGGWHETRVTRRFVAAGMMLAALSILLLPLPRSGRHETPLAKPAPVSVPADAVVSR